MFIYNSLRLFSAILISLFYVTVYAQHPLDGLTDNEYKTVAKTLQNAGKIDDSSRFAMVNLAEPDKAAVLRWKNGDASTRHAFAVIRHKKQFYEAIVDLSTPKLISWTLIENAQPALLDEEWMISQIAVRSDPDWQNAVRKRGIDNMKQVFCFPAFPGNFGTPRDAENRRLGMVSCYDTSSEIGLWGRPLAGLLAVVDYDERKVIELIDTGVIPTPEGGPAVAEKLPNNLRATTDASNRIHLNDNWIEWDKWRFHLRIDPRVGPVLSQVTIKDGDSNRSVLYQGSLSELFVPYMDPTQNWYFRTYLDIGEYGIGTSGVPMRMGIDCPANSVMIDGTFMNEQAKVYTKEGIACVFERETGDSAWSHYDISGGGSKNRRHTELVVRFVVWLGNYDYMLDWIFTETGSLKGRIGATGIVLTRGVVSKNMSVATAADDTRFGRLITPGLVAINHDHFFNFRLDVDIDGTNNRMLIDQIRRVDVKESDYNTPRRQIWQVFPTQAENEADAQLNVDPRQPALWRVGSTTNTNRVGNTTSYQLHPGVTGRTLMDAEEHAHRRAAFTDYNLWVTPYAANERYAAGTYPNQHPGGAGLPAWTSENRSIEDTDIVLWYTIGLHHVVRAEDWPIMPTVQNEFELRPFDFFDHNPTVVEE